LPLDCSKTKRPFGKALVARIQSSVSSHPSVSDHAIPADRATWKYFLQRCWAEGLSKASLSLMAGSGEALASEKTYMTRTLPQGVM
ncbi:glycosyltransferase family 2 protein, partial [Rhizobium ruizarguesonis]